jgi:hypothetical protein
MIMKIDNHDNHEMVYVKQMVVTAPNPAHVYACSCMYVWRRRNIIWKHWLYNSSMFHQNISPVFFRSCLEYTFENVYMNEWEKE